MRVASPACLPVPRMLRIGVLYNHYNRAERRPAHRFNSIFVSNITQWKLVHILVKFRHPAGGLAGRKILNWRTMLCGSVHDDGSPVRKADGSVRDPR